MKFAIGSRFLYLYYPSVRLHPLLTLHISQLFIAAFLVQIPVLVRPMYVGTMGVVPPSYGGSTELLRAGTGVAMEEHRSMSEGTRELIVNARLRRRRNYQTYFDGVAIKKYTDGSTQFQRYFLSFKSGARLELMYKPNVPANQNYTVSQQHRGIIRLALGVETMAAVEAKAAQLQAAGFSILHRPEKRARDTMRLKPWGPTTTA